ncbi:MAG: LemA family protein [Pseudomonadota bacterium]
MEFLIIILLFAAVIGGYVYCYNSLVTAKTKVDEGWSGITVQLKRRHELVPNLVSAARTAMSHESGILDRILDARTQALAALAGGNHEDVNKAEGELTAALQGFVGYTEDNPEITATENIRLLQQQLEETEDQIAASRRLFNGNVQAFNSKVLSIPWNIIANMKKYETLPMFEVEATEMKMISQPVNIAALGMDGEKK